MKLIKDTWEWLFSSPTPIITIVSVVVAYLAYNHQRNQNKKKCALEIAKLYAESFIPRLRYIGSVLESIGASQYIVEFSRPEDFTENELADLLTKKSLSINDFLKLFEKIDLEILDKAYAYSGCGVCISDYHKGFIEVNRNNPDALGEAIYRFIMDFLNDMEAMASQFFYNVAEEGLVYPILHQTFLIHMKNWYFFIAYKNLLDQDRFFPSIIWLYKKWSDRKERNKQTLRSSLMRNNRKKRLH